MNQAKQETRIISRKTVVNQAMAFNFRMNLTRLPRGGRKRRKWITIVETLRKTREKMRRV